MFIDVYKRHDKVPKNDKGSIKWQICKDLIKKLKLRGDDISIISVIQR